MLGFWTPGIPEIVIILVIALLLFGKRLPEVSRSLGKGIVEFKKGIKGIEDDIEDESSTPTPLPPPPPRNDVVNSAEDADQEDTDRKKSESKEIYPDQ